jgi:sigma-B regulation protein RsbU (phosphoserine phosphatase)
MAHNPVKKILLVDDNEFFLKLIGQAFANNGFECFYAGSAEEAILSLNSNLLPDIILSDYEMLEMNGIEFRRHLMNDNSLKDIPFVFLTSLSDSDLMMKGFDLLAIDYVVKDTPVKVIISKITSILSTIEKQRELTELELKKAAASLNFKSIPVVVPSVPGFAIDFWHRAYHDIPGGDFIDFIKVDSRYSFIVLGDVMGKKWMAWFFTFGYLSYIRSAVRFAALGGEYSAANILQKVNSIICLDNILKDILSSLSLILIDSETGEVNYAGAGDLPLLHYNGTDKILSRISSTGILLGLFEHAAYSEQSIVLQHADRLFIFTDGMIDFADETGKKSDYKQFEDSLQHHLVKDDTFTNIKEKLFTVSQLKQVDDQSIISIYKN